MDVWVGRCEGGWVSWWVGGREGRVEVMSLMPFALRHLFQVADVLVRPLSRLCL